MSAPVVSREDESSTRTAASHGPTPKFGLPQALPTTLGSRVDLTSDAGRVAEELGQARGKNLFDGIATLLRLRFETWLEERMKGPILRKLAVRQEVAEAQKQAETAQNLLKTTLRDGSKSGQVFEIEMNRLNRERLLSDLAQYATPEPQYSSTPALPSANAPQPLPPQQITQEQIEALALRAAMNLGPEDSDTDGNWDEYRAELYDKLPVNIAREVERRIHELRAILK